MACSCSIAITKVGERNAAASNVTQFVEDGLHLHFASLHNLCKRSGKNNFWQVLDESQKFYRLLQLLGEWHEHGATAYWTCLTELPPCFEARITQHPIIPCTMYLLICIGASMSCMGSQLSPPQHSVKDDADAWSSPSVVIVILLVVVVGVVVAVVVVVLVVVKPSS